MKILLPPEHCPVGPYWGNSSALPSSRPTSWNWLSLLDVEGKGQGKDKKREEMGKKRRL